MKEDEVEEVPVVVADYVIHDIANDELGFETPLYGKIFKEYVVAAENDSIPDRVFFLSHPDPEISRAAIDLVFTPYELSLNWLKNSIMVETEEGRLGMHVEHSLLAFKARKIDKMINDAQNKLSAATTAEEQTAILETLRDLKIKSVRANKKGLGRIITR